MRRNLVFIVVLCIAGTLSADAPTVSVHIAGEARNGALRIMADPRAGVPNAIRLYSEPSGTLLAVFLNENVPAPISTAWLETVITAEDRQRGRIPVAAMGSHSGSRGEIETNAAPPTDNRLRMVVFGSWADRNGNVREQDVPVSVATNLASFSFTFNRFIRPQPSQKGSGKPPTYSIQERVCCGSLTDCGGGQACLENCPQSTYCCYKHPHPDCMWCEANTIMCGLVCDTCG
jgi:hypothetical protein